jgi:hypothetical protein
MAEIKSESVADFIPESVADLLRNQHDNSCWLAEATVSDPLRGEQPTADRAVSAE